MSRQIIRPLAGYNLRLTAHYSWLLSAALLAVTPFFMEPALMDRVQVAKLGELLISLLGLIVFPTWACWRMEGLVKYSMPSG